MRGRRPAVAAAALAALLALAGCGSDDPPERGPQSPLADPAATEASPEAEPQSPDPDPGELEASDRDQVQAAARSYVAALNRRDAAAVCAAIEPGAVELRDFPPPVAAAVEDTDPAARERKLCAALAGQKLGRGGQGGTPAWKRTTIRELSAVSVGDDEARVTATVTHDFADRSYVSLEEDVIYLTRAPGGRWLLAQPSGSFYRAVGFAEPPLRALAPP